MQIIRPKSIFNSTLGKSHLSVTFSLIAESFWEFAHSVTTVPHVKLEKDSSLKWISTNDILRDFSWRWISNGLSDYHQPPLSPFQYKDYVIWCCDFHYRDATAARPSYLYNWNPILERRHLYIGLVYLLIEMNGRILNLETTLMIGVLNWTYKTMFSNGKSHNFPGTSIYDKCPVLV